MTATRWSGALMIGIALMTGCATYRPAQLSVSVSTTPADAAADLQCSDGTSIQRRTPTLIRIAPFSAPCTLHLSKAGYSDRHEVLKPDLLRENRGVRSLTTPAARKPIQLEPGATPFSLLFAVLVRKLDDLGASVKERAATAAIPDVELHFNLEPTQ